ncbi:MAG: PAS domain S-box protein [Thermodesulfobacteriota bacterium]|nr:PAS domain S-box protein [Thermodesulfobacteriota bacterium]
MANKPTYEQLEQRVKELEKGLPAGSSAGQGPRQTRRDWSDVFQAVGHPTLILDPDHTIKAADRATVEATGKGAGKLVGEKCFKVFHGTDSPPENCPLEKMLRSESLETEAMEVAALGGVCLVTCTPVRDEDGRVEKVIHIATDITDQKRAEEALRKSQATLEGIFRAAPAGVGMMVDRVFTQVNTRLCEMTGYSSEELLGQNARMLYPSQEEYEYVGKEKYVQIHDHGTGTVETRWKRKDGTVIDVLLSSAAIDGNDLTKGVAFTVFDISERKQVEEALRASEAFLNNIIDQSTHAIWISDKGGTLIRINQTCCDLFHLKKEEVVGKYNVLHDNIVKKQGHMPLVESVFREGKAVSFTLEYDSSELEQIRLESSVHVILDVTMSPITDAKGRVTNAVVQHKDVTKQKEAEEALRRSQCIVATSRDLMSMVDKDYVYQAANEAHLRAHNKGREEIVGRSVEELFGKSLFEGKVKPNLDKCLAGDEVHYQDWFDLPGLGHAFMDVAYYPFVADDGTVSAAVVHVRDMTQTKRLEDQLRQAQKMEAIGTLAGGIAHDFNNSLAAIMGYTEMAMGDALEGSSLQRDLREVLRAGMRAKDLVKQILAFSLQTDQELRPIQARPIVQEALKLLRATLPTTIEIGRDLESGSVLMADPTQMHQVLMNLCTNASHAMGKNGGVLKVSTKVEELDADFGARYPDISPGPHLKLTVSDTGHGMDASILERAFDPYFTTKEKGEGTGMGLSVVHGIVKSHGGTITAYSEPGVGASFNVYLPVVKTEVEEDLHVQESLPTGTERILFVDDEQSLVTLGKQMLKSLGYEVVARMSSPYALETFEAQPDSFDLVITDMTMPTITGDNLAVQLMKIRPDIPVILCTGFSPSITEERAKALGIRGFLLKPFLKSDMAKTIRRVLDE